uniref:B-cell receptor CD22 n=1 Tax=Varanus komodoensis TaxID=61221 RepID=A0A8D2INV3_VARKO
MLQHAIFSHILWILKNPMSINPNFLIARKGSCVFIPCQIDEAHYSDKIKATTVVWYFEPHWDNISYDFTGHLLFDSSKSSEDHMALTSPNFWGRVRFVGDLSRSDCSLMITQLQASDSGKYGARVAASVGNHTWRQMLFDQATVDIQGKSWEELTLTLRGLEKHHLFPRNSTIEGGMLQINVSFVPTWEDDQKILTCLLSSKDGTQRSSSTLELDVKFAPKEVKIQQKPAGPIHEGSHVKLSCQVGPANPQKVNYTWYHNGDPLRLDHADEMLIISGAVLEHSGSYWCEVSNDWGSKRSPKIVLHVICE